MKVLRFAVFALVILTAELATGAVIYVDENAVGPPTGVSWTNAFTNLYNALLVAQPGDEIWVAAGVYRPIDSPNRDAVLELTEGIALYGGFNGTETSRNQRNWTANQTVISGDIGIALINTDNSRRLINVVGADAVIDGFRLRGCYDETPLSTGAINVAPGATLWVRNCSFGNNQAEGASVAVVSGIAAFDNCLVEGNTNTSNSGLIHGSAGGIIEIRHCTFSGNVLGGISNVIGGAPVADVRVYNSIIAEGSFNSSILDYIGNSVSEGPVLGATLTAENLITASPLFVNQAAGDYSLQASSPAIDHGSLSIVSSNRDLNGRPRVMNAAPDAGCYEYFDRPIVFVNPTATGNGSGFTWNNALTDLQTALASATAGSQIWVKEGVYRPTTTNNRFTSFTLSHDVPVYGGFVGGETALDQRDWRTHLTILSGNIGAQSDALDNSYNVVVCNQVNGVFTLDGCVVRAGYADGSTAQRQRGAGIRVNNANIVNLYNCTINNNYASDEGAAVFVQNATELRVVSSNIVNNEANLSAAVFANASLLFESTAIISNANTGSGQLKGIVSQAPNYELGLYNCTVTGNNFPGTSSSFLISIPGPFEVRNCIISGNTIPENSTVFSVGFGSSVITRSILQGNPIPNATQNVSYGDPGFFNPAQNDYRLLATSPGFNAGSNVYVGLSPNDANGNPRISFGTVDYGAFEADDELAAIIYVNQAATGANDGTSWANAFTTLQAALATTTENRQIWIATGTYKPSLTDDILESFQVTGRLRIYGGFDGTETSLNERNWVENPVLFSGDIGVPNDELDNSREILVVSGSDLNVYIDGITFSHAFQFQGLDAALSINGSGDSTVELRNCIFTQNRSGAGGVVNAGNCELLMFNCLVYANVFTDQGAVVLAAASAYVNHCVMYANTSFVVNGFAPIVAPPGSSFVAVNSVLYNASLPGQQPVTGPRTIQHCATNNFPIVATDTFEDNLVNIDLLFVDEAAGNFRLSPGSPCINAGTLTEAALGVDLDLNPRLIGTAPDIGCYETLGLDIIYVDANASGIDNGTSWANAFTTIGEALAVAQVGSDIWVAEASYKVSDLADPDVSFTLPDGVDLLGGFSGTETSPDQRDFTLHSIIDGALGSNANGDFVRSKRLMLISGNSLGNRIENMIFLGVEAPLNVIAPNRALHIENAANIEIERCAFLLNAANRGSAVFFANSTGTIRNSVFANNLSQTAGIIGMVGSSDVTLTNVSISGNIQVAGNGSPIGGASGCTLQLYNSIIWGNTAPLSSPNQTTVAACLLDGFTPQNGETLQFSIVTDENPFEVNDPLVLREFSPAIDAGGNTINNDSPVDFYGNARVQGFSIDMGAIESPYAVTPTCLGDFDFDSIVGTTDLLIFLAEFGCASNCATDLDGDDATGTSDLLVFLAAFGANCDPPVIGFNNSPPHAAYSNQ